MENISDIIDLVIKKCIESFEQEQKSDFPEDGINYGKPPQKAIITYGFGERKKAGYQITDIQKKWIYENGCLEETDINREINLKQRSGMYYSEAHFVFCFDTDLHRVYLSMHYGPRYARGILFELKQEGNNLFLGNDEILWVS